MSLRTSLIISYVFLIVALALGKWFVADRFLQVMNTRAQAIAAQAVHQVNNANVEVAENILTRMGEYVVRDKAEDVARELAHRLAGRKNLDYAKLRRDPDLRQLAITTICTPEGAAGYTDVYDRRGFILFHPDPQVEGRHQQDWRDEYPETTALVERSFTEDRVGGSFTFFDRDKQERRRYSFRVHVPGTPLIVGAIVNIDEFFLPTERRIEAAGKAVALRAKDEMLAQYATMNRQVKLNGFIMGLLFSLTGITGGVWLAATISRPLIRLRDGVKAVGEGNFQVAVPERGTKEVVHLAQSFNQLGRQLTEYMEKRDFIRDTFGRYVTMEVVKKLLEDETALNLGGETREVTILMSDLRGFTAMIAHMEPEEAISLLNRYLEKMIEILLDYHAVIDEIMGDGILAFFGAPEPMEDHPARAVACALAMQASMPGINLANAADGLPHLEMGVAVNTGQVVVGNIGSERRTKYSVVGSHVNFAARMEGFALGGQVLVSSSTYGQVKDLVKVRDMLTVEMKGVPEPATLFDVSAIAGPYDLVLSEEESALTPLAAPVAVQLCRIKDKIVGDPVGAAWLTEVGTNAVTVVLEGEALHPFDDVRLSSLDEDQGTLPGQAYGKVGRVASAGPGRSEAAIRFTSVSPEAAQALRRLAGLD